MAKFSNIPARLPVQQVIPTHEGGIGYSRTPRQELFLQAIAEMAEDTYYESAEERRLRLAANVYHVMSERGGWEWIQKFVPWLRDVAQMRSSAVMVASEAAAIAAANGIAGARSLISAACVRADEPAEMLGYWLEFHGRKLPASVKRGIADAAGRLYTERNALKYDGQSRTVRFADVIELTHPKPQDSTQSALFKFLLDKRHDREVNPGLILPKISLDYSLQRLEGAERTLAFERGETELAGWSWERTAGWLPGGLTAEAWERLIPTMGYMALLRNLRNFDQAGVSSDVRKYVVAKLSDPEEVAKSRQFPYRFLSAWKATESLEWGSALEQALSHSVNNVPEFDGRTLILIDTSGSMQSSIGGSRSQAERWEAAALFGGVLASKSKNVDLAIYATGVKAISAPKSSASILRFVEAMRGHIGSVGHGTNTWGAINSEYAGHDRIIVLTDEQSHDYGKNPGCWTHFINLAGYRAATAPQDNRTFAFGGFTDAMFRLLPMCEQGARGAYPF